MRYKIPLKENHIAMWNWLAKHPTKEKENWPGHEVIYRLVEEKKAKFNINAFSWHHCFACMNAIEKRRRAGKKRHICCYCPVDFGIKKGETCDLNGDSSYFKWDDVVTRKVRSKLAKQIAEGWK